MARFQRGRASYEHNVKEVEYAMAIKQLESSTSFERIAMIVLYRERGYMEHPEKPWRENPSMFEEGGVFETVTIG